MAGPSGIILQSKECPLDLHMFCSMVALVRLQQEELLDYRLHRHCESFTVKVMTLHGCVQNEALKTRNLRHWIAMLRQDIMTVRNLFTVIRTELVMMCVSFGNLGLCVQTFHD